MDKGSVSRDACAMTPHVHISPVHGLAMTALVVAIFGTAHLLALSHDNRAARALVSLGF